MVRIGGLASGMDIDSLVGDLMKAERIPLDKMKQKKQILEWKRDDYRSINTLLFNFRSELTQMKLSTNYRAKTTTSTDETKVSSTATSAAAQSSYNISSVERLASTSSKINQGTVSLSTTDKIDPKAGLFENAAKFAANNFNWKTGSVETQTVAVTGDGSPLKLKLDGGAQVVTGERINVRVNGELYEVIPVLSNNDPVPALDPLKNQVAIKPDGTLTFSKSIAKDSTIKVDFTADKKVESITLGAASSTTQLSKQSINSVSSLKLNGTTLNISATAPDPSKPSVRDISNASGKIGTIDFTTGKISWVSPLPQNSKIDIEYTQNYFNFDLQTSTSKGTIKENFLIQGNESFNSVMNKVTNSSVGVSMMYDSFSDKVTLTRKETGNFNTAGEEIITQGEFINNVLKFQDAVETGGENSRFTINGLTTERSSNTFEMNGVSFTLKKTFSDAAVTVAINNDNNKVFENIKNFVTKYNELIDNIKKKTSEERYRSYTPLTDEQREQLSDKQQEQWEEKAKSGLLRNDSNLSSVLLKMRSDFYTPVINDEVSSAFKQLTNIGIKTTSNYQDGGKLEINEAELKKAIETDPLSVEKLFNASEGTSSQKGIVQRLYDTVTDSIDTLKKTAGNTLSTNKQFSLGLELDNVDSSINRFEDRLKQVEDRYWRQFTAMEKAIQRSNEQMNYLTQQFSGA
ncbi:flagellar hook protein [Peribacillus saganii]|uniref:Flagellar hook-associated protein 2 n=1 Tax=Peribacillus saganii TaxID=2303992 RepID=A0A372LNR1_9BACI|nr:flagellar filament capping protein FliD [Peribacillus saganii]RFU69334.1 flagellar hook protein [Peribacillus saganii]